MAEPDPRILNYRGNPPRIPPKTPAEHGWHFARWFYNLLLFLLFCIIALRIGPNEILWGKPASPAPADFIPIVKRNGIPLIRYIKEYQREHGTLPDGLDQLIPKYLPEYPLQGQYFDGIHFQMHAIGHLITYDLTPGHEGWKITGRYANGPIPLPPVTIPPATASTTAPK